MEWWFFFIHGTFCYFHYFMMSFLFFFLKSDSDLLQKPGGIIALLDEAWYDKIFSTRSYTLGFAT